MSARSDKVVTASFSPPAWRRSRQGDEGRACLSDAVQSPSSDPSGHLLPARGEKEERAHRAAAAVVDPEIPAVTIADLGILRGVEMDGDVAVARVTPTYTGCPAVLAIELAVETALREAGFEPRVERVISPAWTTDWITAEGREKLRAYGIAPPAKASNSIRALFGETEVACPRCGSLETARISEFGSTACKALYRCQSCHEPFDYFKCI